MGLIPPMPSPKLIAEQKAFREKEEQMFKSMTPEQIAIYKKDKKEQAEISYQMMKVKAIANRKKDTSSPLGTLIGFGLFCSLFGD